MTKRIYHDVEQNSDEWFQLRLGKVTSSNFGTIMANGDKFGDPAKRYAMKVAIESVTGRKIESYQNEYMIKGTELEPIAKELYETKNGITIINGGFTEYGIYGDSIDGLVEDYGGIEIKCPKYTTHFSTIIKDNYDISYKWQIQGHMWINDLDWIDYISYCPDFPDNKSLYVHRVDRDENRIVELETKLDLFSKMVKEYKDILTDKKKETKSF